MSHTRRNTRKVARAIKHGEMAVLLKNRRPARVLQGESKLYMADPRLGSGWEFGAVR